MHQVISDRYLQHAGMPNAGRIRFLTGASTLLMLAVVAASAYIRASGGIDVQIARGVHRATASSVALLVSALMVLAWGQPRLRAAVSVAFVLMLALSAVGWITGTTPPPAAAFFNQSGGLVLTALLAWIYGRAAAQPRAAPDRKLALAALVLASLQAAFGGTLSIFAPQASVGVLILHAAAGLAAAAAVAALGWRYAACAVLAPALGAVSVVLPAFAAQAGHALAGALLLAAAAYAHALALVYTRATPPSRPLNA
jgi:heme A synthase